MLKLTFYSIAVFFFVQAGAQSSLGTQLKEAKFEIVKKTVEFLSTDTTTFKSVKTTSCTNCKTYDDLKKFAADNGLQNADKYVIEPLAKTSIDTTSDKWFNDLSKFSGEAISKVAGPGKERRKDLPEYRNYEQALAAVKDQIALSDEAISGNNAATDNRHSEAVTNKTAAEGKVSSMQWLPYGLVIILLALLVFTWLENGKNKRKKEDLKKAKNRLDQELQYAQQNISKLKNEISVLEEKAKDRELDIQSYIDRLTQMENEKKPLPDNKQNTKLEGDAAIETAVSSKTVKVLKNTPPAITKYSRYADLGDGFSNAELLDTPDSETIFELAILPNNTGTYKIVSNAEGQKYALSNAQYFLGKTCRYHSFPGNNTKIHTDEPGVIKLNAGKWTITVPAKISFS